MSQQTGAIPSIEALQHQQAVLAVIFSHSRGLDRLDSELLKSCYWNDAEVDYGGYKGNAHSFCELVVGALEQNYSLTQHALGNSLVDLSGAIARVESYCTAWHLLPGNSEELVFSGRYLDKLERRGDCWKLLHRTVVMDWSRRQPVADERNSEAFAALQKGAHRESDPLYAFLKR